MVNGVKALHVAQDAFANVGQTAIGILVQPRAPQMHVTSGDVQHGTQMVEGLVLRARHNGELAMARAGLVAAVAARSQCQKDCDPIKKTENSPYVTISLSGGY